MGGSRINRACDGCRYRKVKCNGANPCSQCAHLDLQCVFSQTTVKRKPGVRGRLVAQLRQKTTNGIGNGNGNGGGDVVASAEINNDIWTDETVAAQLQPPRGGHIFSPPPPPPPPPAVTSVAGIINWNSNSIETTSQPYLHPPHHDAPPLAPPPQPPRQPSFSSPAATSPIDHPYTADFFLRLVPDFEALVYPMSPVVTPDEIRCAVTTMHACHQDAALVYAFAAATINLTQTSWHLNGDVATQMTDLLQRSLAAHRNADIALVTSSLTTTVAPIAAGAAGSPIGAAAAGSGSGSVQDHTAPVTVLGELPVTVKRIMTCLFIEISLMAFKLFDRSYTILREAVSLVLTLKVHAHTPDDPALDRREVARRQRLYWECFIHERFVNIMSGYPCTLAPLRTGLPYTDLSIPGSVDLGFRRLIKLFMIMDDSFFAHWNADILPVPTTQPHSVHPHGHAHVHMVASPVATAASPGSVTSVSTVSSHEVTAEWIERKQAELDEDEADTARAIASSPTGLSEVQHADLYITRLWLRTLVWQLALSRGLLRSLPPEDNATERRHSHHHHPKHHQGLSLHYPAARLSHQLRTLVGRLESVYAIGPHGSGILQKLFEITTTIADVLALPPDQSQDVKSRMEDFIFLVSFLFQFERIPKQERDYMREKVEVLQQMYTVVDFGNLADARSS
jgi:hypothetical protein